MDTVDAMYGVDNSNPLPVSDGSGVNVPSITPNVSLELLTQLRQQVDPLSTSPNHGIDLYEQALSIFTT